MINTGPIDADSTNTDPPGLISAAEAAARLEVKRATLYAYVSRGLLSRTVSIDGRTSLFDPAEVERLGRQRGRRTTDRHTVVVSAITELDEAGHRYRGRPACDFVADGASFEAVADLLWEDAGVWPEPSPPGQPEVTGGLSDLLPSTATAMHRMSMAVTVVAAGDPLRASLSATRLARCGRTIITAMVGALPLIGSPLSGPTDGEAFRLAATLWPRLSAEPPTPERVRALNTAMVLLADHGLASSTFAVRVAASVRSDPYAIVQAGLGTVAGTLHGSASIGAHRLLARASEVGAEAAVAEVMAGGGRVPGVGHTIYRQRDPRTRPLLDSVTAGWPGDDRLGVVDELWSVIEAELSGPINIDFALGALTWLARGDEDRPTDGAAPIFSLARTAGWLAHAIEELGERPVRFRPEGRYVARPASR